MSGMSTQVSVNDNQHKQWPTQCMRDNTALTFKFMLNQTRIDLGVQHLSVY